MRRDARDRSARPSIRRAPDVAYRYRNGLYLNITNRCPTACRFCVKRAWKWDYRGWNLRLGREHPSARKVWGAVLASGEKKEFEELIFCGYGEATYRLPVVKAIGREVKRRFPGIRRRLTTIGLGNLIWGRDITPELAGCVDAVTVSFNTADRGQWLDLHAPLAQYRKDGFAGVLKFVRGCVASGLDTTVTAVEQPGVDIGAVRDLARSLGAGFRLRPFLGPAPVESARGGA